jgi:hypothetical protein
MFVDEIGSGQSHGFNVSKATCMRWPHPRVGLVSNQLIVDRENLMAGLRTSLHCIADFCLVPSLPLFSPSLTAVGVEPSVTKYIAEVQKVVQSSGLKSCMHSYGTTIGSPHSLWCADKVEGPWDQGTLYLFGGDDSNGDDR